jgi:SSS family solute:Na+ symporter
MASSGNILTDVLKKHNSKKSLRYSQVLTLLVGILALFIAWKMENVLDLMLMSYAFMASGMIVPVIVSLADKAPNAIAALIAMIAGGTITLLLQWMNIDLPMGLDPNFFGIIISLLVYWFTRSISK